MSRIANRRGAKTAGCLFDEQQGGILPGAARDGAAFLRLLHRLDPTDRT